MILTHVAAAVAAGAPLEGSSKIAGVCSRTVQRWRAAPEHDDGRCGNPRRPCNALSAAERAALLETVNLPEYRDLSPKQIVPRLADKGIYLASESTVFRLLREKGQLTHRGRARAPQPRTVEPHVATRPNQVWSWDITYLRTTLRGRFFYLYMFLDVFSRKVVGWQVHEEESPDHAARLIRSTCADNSVDASCLALHSDNGGPMRGSTMLATLQSLGVAPSFSRPSVSNDNPYSEALFRTLKYVPAFPSKPFESIEQARAWVAAFVRWYNQEHRHSGINFVTPDQRHQGLDDDILARRHALYARARRRNPQRWSGTTRDWTPTGEVHLNRPRSERKEESKTVAA
jgi:transposase InsO family protein